MLRGRALQLPLDLGRPVRHRSDPIKAVGIILGRVFDPPLGALIRWQHGVSTYEALDDLIEPGRRDREPETPPHGRHQAPPAVPETIGDKVSCTLCRQPIAARLFVFRIDGQVEHVTCPEPARKPLARLALEPTLDPICPACTKPIGPAEGVVKDGTALLHVACFIVFIADQPPRSRSRAARNRSPLQSTA
jgi:hypothetical protein